MLMLTILSSAGQRNSQGTSTTFWTVKKTAFFTRQHELRKMLAYIHSLDP